MAGDSSVPELPRAGGLLHGSPCQTGPQRAKGKLIQTKKRVKTSRNNTKVELVGVKFEPRHWEALASGLADSGSRVERLQLVEVKNFLSKMVCKI